jgi:hypothetical protein
MVYLHSFEPAPPVRYRTMNTLRPLGVTLTPKPGSARSHYTVSASGAGSASMTLFDNFVRGIARWFVASCYLDLT